MRWTRNDTAAYDAVSKAGQSIRDAYDKSRLGDAYKQGGLVTEVTDPELERMGQPGGLQTAQDNQDRVAKFYNDEADWEGPNADSYAGNRQAARGLQEAYRPTSEEFAAAEQSYRDAAAASRKYKVGSGASARQYDTAPTREQTHRGGLQSQLEYLSAQGDVDAAGKIVERLSAYDAAEQTKKLGGLQIGAAERTERENTRHDAYQATLRADLATLGTLTPGSEEHTSLQKKIDSDTMSFDRDKAYATELNRLGVTAKQREEGKERFKTKIIEGLRSPETVGKLLTEQYHDGKNYVVEVDPATGKLSIIQSTPGKDDGKVIGGAPSLDALRHEVMGQVDSFAEEGYKQWVITQGKLLVQDRENQGREKVATIYATARTDNAENKEGKHYIGYDEGGKPIAITAGAKGWETVDGGIPYHGTRVEVVGPGRAASRNPGQDKMAAEVIDQVLLLPSAIKRDPTKLAEATAKIEETVARLHGTTRAQAFPSAPGVGAPTSGSGMGARLKAIGEADAKKAGAPSATPGAAVVPAGGRERYQLEMDKDMSGWAKAHPNASDAEMNAHADQWRARHPGGIYREKLTPEDERVAAQEATSRAEARREARREQGNKTADGEEAKRKADRKARSEELSRQQAVRDAQTPSRGLKAKEPAPAPIEVKKPAPVEVKKPAPVETKGLTPKQGEQLIEANKVEIKKLQTQIAEAKRRTEENQKATREAGEKLRAKMRQEKENR
jgi:hypothetical protein